MFDEDYEDQIEREWLEAAREEAKEYNPLHGYCQRVYFVRTSCKYRTGKNKGKKRKRRTMEVELLKFLPTGRCVALKDIQTPGLDSLAEEVFAGKYIPPDVNPSNLFLEYFRKM